jgi:hypothetical protein
MSATPVQMPGSRAPGVADAHTAGLYVELDLHVSAPDVARPLGQQAMAPGNLDLDFWTSLANTFEG